MKPISKTNRAMTKAVLNAWGPHFPAAFEWITQRLNALGFTGPMSWSEAYSIPFCLNTSESIRVDLSFSRGSSSGHIAHFDCPLVVKSKTIYDKTLYTDTWNPLDKGASAWSKGYVHCLTYHLSHMKWASKQSDTNPRWSMTLQTEELVHPNVVTWFSDFESLMLPFLLKLKTDADLAQAIRDAINYVPPSWVKSDGPGGPGGSYVLRRGDLIGALNRACS